MSMRTVLTIATAATIALVCAASMSRGQGQGRGGGGFTQPDPIAFDDHEGWTSIFDGLSLKNWEGNPDIWHLENAAIIRPIHSRRSLPGRHTLSGRAANPGILN